MTDINDTDGITASRAEGHSLAAERESLQEDDMTFDFGKKNLVYTSQAVEDAVTEKLQSLPVVEQVKCVLRRLKDGLPCFGDLTGKMLANVAMTLLSEGSNYNWVSHEVGGADWDLFKANRKTIKRTLIIREGLLESDLIIAPTKINFPLIDFLFSLSSTDTSVPVVAFKCTWDRKKPFTVRALYDLRCNQMNIPDDQILNIYLITPEKDKLYASRAKSDLLAGSLDADLRWGKDKRVPASKLKTLWENTRIHVLRPINWLDIIRAWVEVETGKTLNSFYYS